MNNTITKEKQQVEAPKKEILPGELEAVARFSKELREGAKKLGKDEVRFLVDYYYQMQHDRIAMEGRIRSIKQNKEKEEPYEVLSFVGLQVGTIESNIKKVLDWYTLNDPVGKWCRSITGLGPVIAAGFLAGLDVTDRPTAGHFWSYCGLNDQNRPWIGREKTKGIIESILGDKKNKDITYEDFAKCCIATKWNPNNLIEAVGKDGKYFFYNADRTEYVFKKEDIISQCSKRPYNCKLKVLCWKLGESFVKFSNNPNDFYGKIYQNRKAYETIKNENLEYKEQADIKAKIVGKTTEAYKAYSQGKLPPAHIHARAVRKAEQIFLSHLHHVMYVVKYGELPPKPYILAQGEHAHMIEVPNFEIVAGYLK